ncbi:MAG TPA: DUF4058 family protein [Isosphaeraceae bacterium]|nr:DUF4058 family protein [Isosphaeraceae bacterium]
MASPFPGMDPYLEGSQWMSVHAQLASVLVRQLNPQSLPRFIALQTRRFVRERPDGEGILIGDNYPDVFVHRQQPSRPGGQTLGTLVPPLRMTTIMRTPVPHVTVTIRDVEHHHLVAAIEILSPTNKRGEGRREYLRRRDRFLGSDVHLLEIDLLRKGRRVPMEEPLPPAPYFVFLSRADQRPVTEVWPIMLDQPLPEIPVPLLPGNADARLDLQSALTTVYDEYGLNYLIDYSKPPKVQLSPEEDAWVDEHLRAAGLRP